MGVGVGKERKGKMEKKRKVPWWGLTCNLVLNLLFDFFPL